MNHSLFGSTSMTTMFNVLIGKTSISLCNSPFDRGLHIIVGQ